MDQGWKRTRAWINQERAKQFRCRVIFNATDTKFFLRITITIWGHITIVGKDKV